MIWTISSRASPLPPGNWCEALSTVWAWLVAATAQRAAAAAKVAANLRIGLPPISLDAFLSPKNAIFPDLSKYRSTQLPAMAVIGQQRSFPSSELRQQRPRDVEASRAQADEGATEITRMIRLASIVLMAVMVVGCLATTAQTSDTEWPQRPIRLIVPFPAGASTDIIARIVGQKLSQRLGQQIVIENRAGASGNIGADAIAKAGPGGYTMGLAPASTHAVAASLSASLPYDPIKDFAPVAMLGSQPYVLVLHPGLPAHNLAELIALAKAKPGTLNYGSA